MNKQLLKNTVALIASNVTVRVLGLIYKIWLAKTVLPEALGYYQLSLTVYMFFISLPCSGLPSSISRHYAQFNDKKTRNQVIFEGLRLGIALAIAGGVILGALAPLFSWLLLKNIGYYSIFLALIPSIVFGGGASVLYGYLHASSKSTVVAVSELVEQLCKILAVFLLLFLSGTSSAHTQATYMVSGTAIGGTVSFIIILASVGKIKKDASKPIRSSLVRSAFPLTANRFITSFLGIITATLIPIRLAHSGLDINQAFSVYGVINAMAMPVIMLPSTLISALCVTLLPRFSAIKASGRTEALKKRANRVISLCCCACLFFAIILMLFANTIGSVLFSNDSAQRYIFILAPCCLFVGLNQLCSTILTSLGNEGKVFKIHIISSVISIVGSYVLTGIWGGDGYSASIIIQSLTGSVLFLTTLRNYFKKQLPKQKNECILSLQKCRVDDRALSVGKDGKSPPNERLSCGSSSRPLQ